MKIISKKRESKMKRLILLLFFSTLILGCKNKSVMYVYSLNKSQCITIISENNERYIINGRYDKVPDTNYVKLSIKDRNSIWDVFYVLWQNKKYEWDIVVENSIILESRLDTSRFNFNTQLPNDKRGIPTEIKFRNEGGAIYSFYLKKLTPDRGAIIEYK